MAPVVTAIQPPVIPTTKIKRPIPPGIQTNGVVSSKSSPSPSLSSKKPPNSASGNGPSTTPARPANKSRRETSVQISGRNSRNSAGLRSASLAADTEPSRSLEPPPYVVTDQYILKKYAGNPPSLVVHMHTTHFRFDQQDGIFPYKSPMKVFLEHLRTRTVPHDLLEYFTQGGVPFYEGCLIVQVHDHKSVAQSTKEKDVARPASASSTVVHSSIHNHNPYIVPSSWVPYPKENLGVPPTPAITQETDSTEKSAEEIDKENMPAPSLPGEGQKSKPPPQPKTFTVVLHPTSQSLHMDLLIKASTPRGSSDARGSVDAGSMIPPSTPISLMPPTPTAANMPPPAKKQKRERMELDGSNIRVAESHILLATNAPLVLEPTKNAEATIALLDALAHPKHAESPPQPKTRKRTVAEMAADEALAAEQERYMLTLDERLASTGNGAQGGASGADGEASAVVATFEPRFERFKVIADIKREHAERKEQEKIKQAENDRRLTLQKQQLALEQQQQLAAQRQQQQQEAAEKMRSEQAARESHALQERQKKAAAAAAQAAANAQNAANAAMHRPHPQNGMPGGGPVQNGPQNHPSGIPAQTQARFAQASQAPVSSPVVRQGTPLSVSSPMVASVPMQQSNSSMAASPPRPPSVVQAHPPNMGAIPMAHSMSARGSQQSHHSNTPRMPHSTPNMQATPINRPAVVATPRMSQASPPPNMMAQASHMGQGIMMNNQGMPQQVHNPNVIAAQVAQQQRAIQQQQMAAALQSGMMNGNINGGQPLTPQQQHLLQQQMTQRAMMMQQQQHQQQQQQQQRGNMMTQQLAQRYAQTINSMQANQMNGQMTPQMQAQLQAQLAQQMNPMQRQMAAGQNMMNGQAMNMQAMMMQQQQQQAQQQQNAAFANQVKLQGQVLYNKNIANFAAKFGGAVENIPPESMEHFKRECMMQAKAQVQNMLAQRRAQQVMLQQQQQQQQQVASMQGMGGMMGPQGM